MTAASASAVPLVVDVDGTLIRTDLLHEATLQFVARHPLESWRLLPWVARGKAALKRELADRVEPALHSLPLRDETVAVIRQAQGEGRPVFLASASDQRYVSAIAERVGGITGVLGTDGRTNLAGSHKAAALVKRFGQGGFDYIGDRPVDMPVWSAARRALVVAHSAGFERRVQRAFPQAEVVARSRVSPRQMLKAMRPHQWAKNLLVFLPLIAGHSFGARPIATALLAFLCFSLAASSAYIINDLLDLPGDREHPRKHRRPFASGAVPAPHGLVLGAVLMIAALAFSLLLPGRFAPTLIAYVALTLAYSFFLKRKLLVDVIVLGGLYTIRVFGGLAALGEMTSPWLLMFSLFLFLSLAAVKRCSELVQRRDAGKSDVIGRGYRVSDLGVLVPLAAAAGYAAVLVVTLYLSSSEVVALYAHPRRMWLICPLLIYWISRVLVLSHRGELHDDPVIFALTDKVSWLTGAAVAGVVAISL